MFVNRIERLFPSPASKHLSQNAEGEGEQHPRPVHLVCQHMLESREVLTSVHPIKNGSTQQDGEDDFGRICQERFHFHGCKDSANRAKYQIYLDISEMPPIFERSSKMRIKLDIRQQILHFLSFFVIKHCLCAQTAVSLHRQITTG